MKKLIGNLVLLAVLALAGFVYYLKYPDVRAWVDANVPIVKKVAAPVIAQWDQRFPQPPAAAPADVAPDKTDVAAASPSPAVAPQTSAPSAAVAVSTPAPVSDTVDIAQLSQSRNEWPKQVVLKKEVEFPAVLDGKVVGSVKAPAGTQALLIVIQAGKAGVEYQGGGAMVDIADTNLIEQVQSNRHAGIPRLP
ncbi:MAG: hypothetical protein WCD79_21115 [Chthoniobacteraceae bacterium]